MKTIFDILLLTGILAIMIMLIVGVNKLADPTNHFKSTEKDFSQDNLEESADNVSKVRIPAPCSLKKNTSSNIFKD